MGPKATEFGEITFWMTPCPGNNKREEKEIPTKISNVIEPTVCDI